MASSPPRPAPDDASAQDGTSGSSRGTAACAYNIDSYYREVNRDLHSAFPRFPVAVGGYAPAFELPTTEGTTVALDRLLSRGHVVLLFGCYSAPPCVKEMPEFNRLGRRLGDGFRLVFVYTREIHPNESLPYGFFPPHRTIADKIAVATRMREDLGMDMTVAVDDLEGSTHLAYGGLPYFAMVVRSDGLVIHRSQWASVTQLESVTSNLAVWDQRTAAGQQPRMSYSETLWAMERLDKKP